MRRRCEQGRLDHSDWSVDCIYAVGFSNSVLLRQFLICSLFKEFVFSTSVTLYLASAFFDLNLKYNKNLILYKISHVIHDIFGHCLVCYHLYRPSMLREGFSLITLFSHDGFPIISYWFSADVLLFPHAQD